MLTYILIIYKQNLYATKCLKSNINADKIYYEIIFIKDLELQKANTVKQTKNVNMRWLNTVEETMDSLQDFEQQYIIHM